MNAERFSFLLGAGISRPSGGPTVEDITRRVLNGRWESGTDTAFWPRKPDEASDQESVKAQQLIRILHAQIEQHIREKEQRLPNYEDYFAALLQVVQDETGEIINPMVRDNVARLRQASEHLHVGGEDHIYKYPFASLADRATVLIQHAALQCLHPLKKPVGLGLLGEVVQRASRADIFTLNHDLLVERELTAASIPFTDGFGEKDGDVRPFAWAWDTFTGPVHLLKLHGSIDWYRVRHDHSGIDQFVRMSGSRIDPKDGSGRRLSPLDVIPNFLTGTSVKEQSYGVSLFGDIFEHFRRRLRETNILICSGYGWGDKGINTRIRQWLYDAFENRVIVLHGADGEPLERKRFWYWYWDDFIKCGKVIHISKWLCDCTFDDIRSALRTVGPARPLIFQSDFPNAE
jgi:hypothetical protein